MKILKGENFSFCPDRGGIITSLILGGKEILYMDRETLLDTSKSVRGGIPILFPNAGPIEGSQFPELKQHGFARTSSAWKCEMQEQEFIETLRANEATKRVFPFDFELRMRGKLEDNGSFTLTQEVLNLAPNQAMPVAMGLHPYFKVPDAEKRNITFDFPGDDVAEAQAQTWMDGGMIALDNPTAPLRITLPTIGTLVMNFSKEYEKIWIWSLPGKDFICIEPMMREPGGFVSNPEIVKEKPLIGKTRFKLDSKEVF